MTLLTVMCIRYIILFFSGPQLLVCTLVDFCALVSEASCMLMKIALETDVWP